VLSAEEQQQLEDGGEVSAEDILAAQMTARAADDRITFVAFTATPKTKTMELFGTRPDPSRKPAPDNVPEPFHVYSMRHALKRRPDVPLILPGGEPPKLTPIEEAGRGQVRERATAHIAEIIERLNDLFHGELTDQDKLVYVNERRGAKGRFKESDDVGNSLSADRRKKAKAKAKRGQGDKGDR